MSLSMRNRMIAGLVVTALGGVPAAVVAQDDGQGQPVRPGQQAQPEQQAQPRGRQATPRVQVGGGNQIVIDPRGEGPPIYRGTVVAQEMKPQTYLGITTRPITGEVAAQVGELPEGVGLIVTYVDPEGPAAEAGIQEHDVLVQFEDQWLINPAQLTVLVRMQEAGEEAALKVLRRGQEQLVGVALVERDLPVLRPLGEPGVWQVAPLAPAQVRPLYQGQLERLRSVDAEQMARVQEQIERSMRELEQQLGDADNEAIRRRMTEVQRNVEELTRSARERAGTVQGLDMERLRQNALRGGLAQGGRMIVRNDDIFGEMIVEGEEITVRITEPDGEEIYSGPLPDEEATRELPEAAQQLIKQFREALPAQQATPPAPRAAPPAPPVRPANRAAGAA